MCQRVFIVKRKKRNEDKVLYKSRVRVCGVCFARNKVIVSGKVNDCNCSCVNYFLQLNLFKLREGESGKWVTKVIIKFNGIIYK